MNQKNTTWRKPLYYTTQRVLQVAYLHNPFRAFLSHSNYAAPRPITTSFTRCSHNSSKYLSISLLASTDFHAIWDERQRVAAQWRSTQGHGHLVFLRFVTKAIIATPVMRTDFIYSQMVVILTASRECRWCTVHGQEKFCSGQEIVERKSNPPTWLHVYISRRPQRFVFISSNQYCLLD